MNPGPEARPRQPVTFLAFLLVLAVSPLPLGSNRPLPLALLEVSIFLLLFLAMLDWRRHGAPNGSKRPALRFYIWLGLVWLSYHLVQIVPMPPPLVAYLNPDSQDAYDLAEFGASAVIHSLSVDRYESLGALIQSASYLAVFAMAFIWGTSVRRALLILRVLLVIGLGEVCYGVLSEVMADGQYSLGAVNKNYLALEGTYVNPNHLAGFLELAIGSCLGLLVFEVHRHPRDEGLLRPLHSRAFLWTSLVVLIAGLLLTASRGGIIAMIVCSLVLVFPPMLRGRLIPALTRKSLVGGLVVSILIGLLAFNGLAEKLATKANEVGRLDVWQSSITTLANYPLFGSGAGTFAVAAQPYKPRELGETRLGHAHNDYLEFLVEYGLLGGGILLVMLLKLIRSLGTVYKFDASRGGSTVLWGASIGVVSILLHGVVDFNLQIPANALWFCTLAAVIIAQASRAEGGVVPRKSS